MDASGWTNCDGTEVTGLANGTYYVRVKASGTALASDNQEVTVAAYTAPGTYTVTLPGGTGYTVAAEGGSTSPVAANGSYSFTVTIASGYQKGSGFAVKANGIALTEESGKYTINNITANQTVTVEGC